MGFFSLFCVVGFFVCVCLALWVLCVCFGLFFWGVVLVFVVVFKKSGCFSKECEEHLCFHVEAVFIFML